MRIAIVLTGGLHPSGREQVIPVWLWLIERLAWRHEVHAFAVRHLTEATSYPLAGAMVHDLGRPHGRLAQWKALREALEREGPFDIVHGYWVDPAGALAAVAGRRLGMPSIVTCDSGEFTAIPGIDYGLQRSARGQALLRLACRLATQVHVTTAFMEALARQHGVEPVRIPFGVHLAQVWGSTTPPSIAREDGPPWRLLQMASLNRVKDQSTLIRALAIARQTLDVHLDLVGEDTFGDGRLQREAAALGVSDSVTFHGFKPVAELPPLRARVHVYVQSSRHEAAGIAVLEAAAAGLPIVGTRVGYVSDWSPQAAVGVSPADPEALATALVATLRNRAEREHLAAAARARAMAHDVDWTAQALSDLYASIRQT
jgi:glycosyltransferase involved in cell wall biosynthesis